ncbi:NAD(P)/FAD-dependent oxidoreductase [Nonomuraea jiangxiensis]|uniref:NADH dehydrogenase, FAD-containing subunit n=1 Tax=Nonomuraea jiangxiensis TaxID=633440 RepID=A0A1G8HXI4_9ACTN|nr:FAD-dependent oxidoreductase [Nonomuraea jiangxiensis]SDI11324.1 NADH dehydrogenase, FAD-containing subunit [Nonomuraea jiangxiensis]
MTDILVLGAGYTGTAAAIRAAVRTRRLGGRVTLVNASPRFTERLRLHQTAAGARLADHALEDVVAGTGIEFVLGRVAALDAGRHEVRLEDGRVLGYDKLVYALGTVTDDSVPGVAEHAHTFDDHQRAVRLAERLDALRTGTVVVAGGGLTGIEAATELAEAHPHLHVVLLSRGRPGAMMGERARAYLEAAMERLGIEVRAGVEVTKVLPDAVELAGGELVHSDATLWTTGTKGLPVAAGSGLTLDARGRIVVDSALRSVSHPDVYAVGDAAAVSQRFGVLHGTCQGGIPTGLHAADSLTATLRGRTPKPFRFGYVHQPLSLGRKDAVIQFTRPDDSPRRAFLKGRAAILYKETVSSSPLTTYKLLKRGLVPVALFSLTAGPGA